jgi:hypothetical protein
MKTVLGHALSVLSFFEPMVEKPLNFTYVYWFLIIMLLLFFLYYFKRAVLNRQNDRHWSATADVSFRVFCERKSDTNITTHFPPAYNTICNNRCAFYFSEVLKLYRLCNKKRMRKKILS